MIAKSLTNNKLFFILVILFMKMMIDDDSVLPCTFMNLDVVFIFIFTLVRLEHKITKIVVYPPPPSTATARVS